jgi:hypothetical protein
MKVIEIVNNQRQLLGRILQESPGQLTLEIIDSQCDAELKALIEQGQKQGFLHRTGRPLKKLDRTIFIDEQITVKPENEKFLEAMSEAVSRYTFGGQRAFGLIKEQ